MPLSLVAHALPSILHPTACYTHPLPDPTIARLDDGTGTTLSGEDTFWRSLDGTVYGEVWWFTSAWDDLQCSISPHIAKSNNDDGTGTALSGEDTFQCSLDGAVYGKVWCVSSVKFNILPVHGTTCDPVSALTLWTSTMNSNATLTINTQCMRSLQQHWHCLRHAHQPSQNISSDNYKVSFTTLPMDSPH